MYTPDLYKAENPDDILQFVQQYPFATVLVNGSQSPEAVHLPLLLSPDTAENEGIVLLGHLAYSNPIAKRIMQGCTVLVIFAGPEGYISPRWYNHPNVPTWNYMAIHATGTAKAITEKKQVLDILAAQGSQFEPESSAWSLARVPAEMMNSHLPDIIGFEITVTNWQATFKLSQNRSDSDYINIVSELERKPDTRRLADEMKKMRPYLFTDI